MIQVQRVSQNTSCIEVREAALQSRSVWRDPFRALLRNPYAWVVLIAFTLRLVTLSLYPLTDTTEARYSEIARKMVETGNVITPQSRSLTMACLSGASRRYQPGYGRQVSKYSASMSLPRVCLQFLLPCLLLPWCFILPNNNVVEIRHGLHRPC
ncbi:Polymyxin resistance protein ArnT, undecaprenyl phosphate-alpha-L-Ara4N transferase; Melittin resistance protein PqaB [hydrothermal vent metagenome]|uniref:Polymyxin resistance protein ArnT, undecaprenyl phosphate-alpha-L-Ara4N transferase Melittin resistance protein PqaB n=1 Tax=hydrothermal vent metagenome TaxID=652676 RepID=A0A3B0ZPI8_9ZZZZ